MLRHTPLALLRQARRFRCCRATRALPRSLYASCQYNSSARGGITPIRCRFSLRPFSDAYAALRLMLRAPLMARSSAAFAHLFFDADAPPIAFIYLPP